MSLFILNFRNKFYEVAKKGFAVIASGDPTFYANIVLTKGVVPGEEGKEPGGYRQSWK